ncbi:MAG TPA: tetratricopeptide repeat protein, partial [Acetivibrio clariflavus]|nr:tetratricopeptide repeat protein [Acetivibrio clariflavus]
LALAYYVNLMIKHFAHQDFSIVVMFLTNEKYEQAFKHFYEAYTANYEDSYAKLAIVTGYLNNNEEMLLKIGDVVINPSYKRIIEAILSNNSESVLLQDDLNDYLEILKEIIKIGKEDYIDKFIDLKYKFEENIGAVSIAIGNLLKDNGYYKKAIELYENEETNEIQNKFFTMGYCYYKMGELEQAQICFEKALENGYHENEIKTFLQWINEKLNDIDTKITAKL